MTPNALSTWVGAGVIAISIAVSLAVLIAARFPVAPLRDAATLQSVTGVYLSRSDAYIAFAPFSDVFNAITLLSERQHIAVLLGVLGIWSLYRFALRGGVQRHWRESMRSFVMLLASIAGVYTAAACLPRPMALRSPGSGILPWCRVPTVTGRDPRLPTGRSCVSKGGVASIERSLRHGSSRPCASVASARLKCWSGQPRIPE
jgi:hypothetical protein